MWATWKGWRGSLKGRSNGDSSKGVPSTLRLYVSIA
jgi:hypothetical protein